MDFLGIGSGEILLIVIIAIIFLGPEQLPEVAASIGRMIGEIRRASQEISQELAREFQAPEIVDTSPPDKEKEVSQDKKSVENPPAAD